jgi:RES domain-containing protein
VIVATIETARRATVRLVHSARLKPPILEALAPTADLLAALTELAGATSGRLEAEARGLGGLDPRELAFNVPHAKFINAAFAYPRATGNRFNGSERGAWYCGFDVATAIAEVGFHLTRELDCVGRYDNTSDYAEMRADFIGLYHDLRGAEPDSPCLHPDPAIGYPAGQELAAALMAEGSPGLIYPSVRHRDGTCLVAFRPAVVQNVRQGAMWRLTWAGSRAYAASRLPS